MAMGRKKKRRRKEASKVKKHQTKRRTANTNKCPPKILTCTRISGSIVAGVTGTTKSSWTGVCAASIGGTIIASRAIIDG